ncbi:MAG TPA: hypothetical protein VGI06_08795, partial [Acidimicrobiales bacterium]
QLTYLMVEHVYLLARVTQQAATAARSAPSIPPGSTPSSTTSSTTTASSTTLPAAVAAPTADSLSALDHNSHDISDWLAQAQGYGPGFDAAFYSLWAARIGDFLDYAKSQAAGDKAGATAATSALATNATAIAKLVHNANKYVAVTTVTNPGTGLADELAVDNQSTTTFIDDQATGASTAAADLVTAAEGQSGHLGGMYHTAVYLAAAAAKLDSDQYPGTADLTAANLRASVTMAFVEHVELASLELDAIAQGLPVGPWTAAVASNTSELHNIVALNYSDQDAAAFDTLWNRYLDGLTAYTRAKIAGDQAGAATAAGRLSGVAPDLGNFFHARSKQLSADSVTADVAPVVSGLQAVADAAAANAPDAMLAREAAGFVPKLASDLSEAIALEHPALYAP